MEPTLHPGDAEELTLADYGARPTRCRYCPAQIGFVLTAGTNPMPLDWKANPGGNVRIVSPHGIPVAVVLTQDDLFPPDPDIRWMPHFENCAGAEEARRR